VIDWDITQSKERDEIPFIFSLCRDVGEAPVDQTHDELDSEIYPSEDG